MSRRNRIASGAMLTVVLLSGVAGAQDRAEPADVLRGPSAAEAPAKRSIVMRDGTGALQPLDTRPEQAAVEVLGLKPQERSAVDRVFAEHAAAVHALLFENLALFTRIQSARQSGDREAVGPMLRALEPSARPLLDPPLGDRVAGALPEDRREEFRGLVREYAGALAEFEAQSRGGRMDDAKRPAREGAPGPFAARRFEMNQLLREMARTLRTVTEERKARTEEILRQVEATPEQEATIRAIVREAGEVSGGKPPSAEQRRETFRRILDVLTPEQRRRAMERLRGEPER